MRLKGIPEGVILIWGQSSFVLPHLVQEKSKACPHIFSKTLINKGSCVIAKNEVSLPPAKTGEAILPLQRQFLYKIRERLINVNGPSE